MQDVLPQALFARSLAPADDLVNSLRNWACKTWAFFFGLFAYTKYLPICSIRLRGPAFALVDDVFDRAHICCLELERVWLSDVQLLKQERV